MRRDPQRLTDILEALDWIATAVAAQTEADFLADETLCSSLPPLTSCVSPPGASPGTHCIPSAAPGPAGCRRSRSICTCLHRTSCASIHRVCASYRRHRESAAPVAAE